MLEVFYGAHGIGNGPAYWLFDVMANGSITHIVEIFANLAIIGVAVVVAVLFYRGTLDRQSPAGAENRNRLEIGTKLALPLDQALSDRKTLVYFLSLRCRFCSESMPFYKRIHETNAKNARVRTVAVLPESVEDAETYFSSNGIVFDEILTKRPSDLGISGTPTLVLLDADQYVMAIWSGKLPPEAEERSLLAIFD